MTVCSAEDVAAGDVKKVSALVSWLRDRFDVDYHFRNIVEAGGGPAANEELDEYATATSPPPQSPPSVAPLVAKGAALGCVLPQVPTPTAKPVFVVPAPAAVAP
jgi:hypothetical protein